MANKEQKVFHIGDTHFYDNGIIRVEDRPFKTVEEMNQAIIDNWNSHVGEDDIVWHHEMSVPATGMESRMTTSPWN